MSAGADIDISTVSGNVNIDAINEVNIGNAVGDNIDLNGAVQVETGTFALENGTTVNNIVTVIDGNTMEDDLVTEAAIIDLVGGLAGSGLTLNTATLAIDLGGFLTTGAYIDGNGSQLFDLHNVTDLSLQSNVNIDIDAASLLDLTGESIGITASGADIDINTVSGNVNVDAANDMYLEALNLVIVSGTGVGITASNGISISSTNGTKITSGTFALKNPTATDEITINIVGDDDTNLVTEGAVFSFVSASLNNLAGSGLTFNGTAIDLGGTLTTGTTTIDTNGNELLVTDGTSSNGRFGVIVDAVGMDIEGDIDISSNATFDVAGESIGKATIDVDPMVYSLMLGYKF